jgi:hypothetical protein
VVLANNLNDASGVLAEYAIVCSSASSETNPSQIGSFELGSKKAHGSSFAYRSMRTAGVLLDQLDGVAINDREISSELIPVINRVARLQTVKCAPPTGLYGTPGRAMLAACPPMLLAAELEILKPSVVLTLGRHAKQAVSNLAGYQPFPHRGRTQHGRLDLGGSIMTVYSVAHPTRGGMWQADHAALQRHLRRAQKRADG